MALPQKSLPRSPDNRDLLNTVNYKMSQEQCANVAERLDTCALPLPPGHQSFRGSTVDDTSLGQHLVFSFCRQHSCALKFELWFFPEALLVFY
ncbi:hypothetical protein Y032_0301g1835 [Ancylostoma ceylanicum]|uniref:Uncharacterized protein n=1 Tax=Ancylostoma ceylanicum TaxID=53326 RepID=A0A016S3P9_9BILA|nr:hypothetical protein Y032_0301g1835 [Ancylostoma ceylanicum]